MRTKTIAAWVTTGLFAALMTTSGLLYLVGARLVVHAMSELGYPDYFRTMLGIAKLLGIAGILSPWPRLREWAYAGFTFDLVAAIVSHVATGGIAHAPQPLLALGLMLGSYVFRARVTFDLPALSRG
jgi:hypothetical protein